MSTTRSSLLYRTTRSRLRNTSSQPEDAELPVAAPVNTASKGSPQLATAVDTPSKFTKFVTETCPRPYNKSPTETTAKESKVTAVNKPKMSAGAERVPIATDSNVQLEEQMEGVALEPSPPLEADVLPVQDPEQQVVLQPTATPEPQVAQRLVQGENPDSKRKDLISICGLLVDGEKTTLREVNEGNKIEADISENRHARTTAAHADRCQSIAEMQKEILAQLKDIP